MVTMENLTNSQNHALNAVRQDHGNKIVSRDLREVVLELVGVKVMVPFRELLRIVNHLVIRSSIEPCTKELRARTVTLGPARHINTRHMMRGLSCYEKMVTVIFAVGIAPKITASPRRSELVVVERRVEDAGQVIWVTSYFVKGPNFAYPLSWKPCFIPGMSLRIVYSCK